MPLLQCFSNRFYLQPKTQCMQLWNSGLGSRRCWHSDVFFPNFPKVLANFSQSICSSKAFRNTLHRCRESWQPRRFIHWSHVVMVPRPPELKELPSLGKHSQRWGVQFTIRMLLSLFSVVADIFEYRRAGQYDGRLPVLVFVETHFGLWAAIRVQASARLSSELTTELEDTLLRGVPLHRCLSGWAQHWETCPK